VWSIYFLKHVFSILAYLGQKSESEPIMGRFVDARNYLDLGWGLVKEQAANDSGPDTANSITSISYDKLVTSGNHEPMHAQSSIPNTCVCGVALCAGSDCFEHYDDCLVDHDA
jgi:hypothetical protein